MSEVVDGVRVITEGPPPVRDVTDPPSIPARFTPTAARERASEPEPVEVPARAIAEPEAEDPEASATVPMVEREVMPDTLVEATLDPQGTTGGDDLDDELFVAAGPPFAWIAVGLALVAVALAAVGALALW